jgi:hypothetical protein
MPNPGMPTSGPLDPNDYESWSSQFESEPAQGTPVTSVPAKGGRRRRQSRRSKRSRKSRRTRRR